MDCTHATVATLLLVASGCGYDWSALDPRLGEQGAAGSAAAGAPGPGGATAAAGGVVAGGGAPSPSGSAGEPSGGIAGTAGAAVGPIGGGEAGAPTGGSGGAPAGAGAWAGSEAGSGGGPAGAGGWAGSEVGSGGSPGAAGHAGAGGNQGAGGSVAGGTGGLPGGTGGTSGGSAGTGGTSGGSAGAAGTGGAAGTEGPGGAAGAAGGCASPCGRYEVCLNGACTLPCSGVGLPALFVVADVTLTAADAVVNDWLQTTLGFTVTTLTADAATTADADGRALVVISSTVGSGAVNTKFTTVSAGVITWEANVYDDLLLTGPTSGTDYGSGVAATSFEIVTPTSPLAVGLSDAATVLSATGDMAWGVPASGAAIIARPTGSSTQAAVFAFETGATLYDASSAAGRRMGCFLNDTTATDVTEDGERLILAALCWTAGLYP